MAAFGSRMMCRLAAAGRQQQQRLMSSQPSWLTRQYPLLAEAEAKALLQKNGVKVQPFAVSSSADEAKRVAQQLHDNNKAKKFFVKAASDLSGRSTGKVVDSVDAVKSAAEKILGSSFEGSTVSKVSVSTAVDYNVEFHVAFARDTAKKTVLIFSPDGTTPIEQVVKDFPGVVISRPLGDDGLSDETARELAYTFGFTDWVSAAEQLKKLYDVFQKTQARYLEINPWVQTTKHEVYAVGAKLEYADRSRLQD